MLLLIVLICIVVYMLPVYRKPQVFRQFITPEECAYIMETAQDKLSASTISENRTVDKTVRDSKTAWLEKDDPIVKKVIERCIALTDRPITNCEKLQVLKYEPGGFYRPHHDACCLKSCEEKNQRMFTFIIVLSDDFRGGETKFPTLKKSYKLNTGDVLFFDNLDNYGMCTTQALHGGEPVLSGEKWICNLWVRTYPYN